jgi:hypothetical protein
MLIILTKIKCRILFLRCDLPVRGVWYSLEKAKVKLEYNSSRDNIKTERESIEKGQQRKQKGAILRE